MRVFVPAPPAAPARKTNITRPSSITAVKELKRILDSTDTADSPILVARQDLVVFDRLINFGFNLPDSVYDYSLGSNRTDGSGANPTT